MTGPMRVARERRLRCGDLVGEGRLSVGRRVEDVRYVWSVVVLLSWNKVSRVSGTYPCLMEVSDCHGDPNLALSLTLPDSLLSPGRLDPAFRLAPPWALEEAQRSCPPPYAL